jgi:FMN phosphatase YigB (HAD superfamily)
MKRDRPPPGDVVILVDVDNTLIDNDAVRDDFRRHLLDRFGAVIRDRYWAIEEGLFGTLGYRDYLGAVQQLRLEYPGDMKLLSLSSYFLDFPFAERLYPRALDVLRRLGRLGRTVILSDGDAIFQPRKIECSGLAGAAGDRVLIYVHKEDSLDDIRRQYPADHYVLIDDKLRILSAVKAAWGANVTTIFPRQGQFADDPKAMKAYPRPDATIARIADLIDLDLAALIRAQSSTSQTAMVTS